MMSSTVQGDSCVTRERLVRLLFSYLDPLRSHYSADGARLELGHTGAHYEDATIPIEAFARPLWGLAPFWAGGGHDAFFEDVYRRGLVAGTDPASAEYFGECHDRDQRFVEMAAIAYGLMLAPQILWDPLDQHARDNVVAWLGKINEHACPDNNWLFFPVIVNLALARLGRVEAREDVVERNLTRLDSFHVGDGWYTDGPVTGNNGMLDYYDAFGFSFYAVLFAKYLPGTSLDTPGIHRLAERFSGRIPAFLDDYLLLFSDGGESVPYGRSQTYRFAQSALPSLVVTCGGLGRDLSVLKGVITRNLLEWACQPTVDNGGVLTIGYHYPCLHMAEDYNAPGSPLWSLKAFACLALPTDDPFWQLPGGKLPQGPALSRMAAGNQLVQRRDGEVTLYVGGRTAAHSFCHTEEKYSKFCYSTRYGFSVSRSDLTLAEAAPDSTLAFEVNGRVFYKGRTESYEVGEDRVLMSWSPWPGIEVRTTIRPTSEGHVREHVVRSDVACVAYDCGFALPLGDDSCRVLSREGDGVETVIKAEPNTNLMCPKTTIPALRYEISRGETRLVTEVCSA